MEIVYHHFITIDSTNTWAKLNCHLFDENKITLITADAQTAGRGRFKRKWVSPAYRNIYATFCFAFDPSRLDIGNIPQVMSLSVANVLRTFNLQPKLKWPNDLLLSNKKLGGILCETVSFENKFMIILGVGLNINMSAEDLEQIDQPATSLKNETGNDFEVKSVLKAIEKQFIVDFDLFLNRGFAPFLEEYKKLLWINSGELMSFHNNTEVIKGTFHSIKDDGSLILNIDGSLQKFISGEVV